MILRVAIHPKTQFWAAHELFSDRLGMGGAFCLLAHTQLILLGSLRLE
jgi:hypothetical protein